METVCEDERKPSPAPRPQRLLQGWLAGAAIGVASVATIGVVIATVQLNDARSLAGLPDSASHANPTPVKPGPGVAPLTAPAAQPAAAFAIDEHGFVESEARCDPAQHPVAIGRTSKSEVVVCEGAGGRYHYTGVRLSDGAAMRLDDVRVTPTGFEAHSDGARYVISSKELVVMSGPQLVARDAMVEYRTPRT